MSEQTKSARTLPTGPGWWWVSIDGREPTIAKVWRRGADLVCAFALGDDGEDIADPYLAWLAPVAPVGSVPPEVYARDVLGPFAHTTRDVERTLIAHGATREDAARLVAKVTP